MAEEKGKSYSHILKYTSLFGSIQVLNVLVGLVRNKFVALILGPDGMGLASLFNSTIKLFSDTVNLGVPMSGVREVAEAYDSGDIKSLDRAISSVRMLSMLTAVVGALLCVLLARLLDAWTFGWGNHSLHFVLLAPAIAFTVMAAGETAIVKGTKQLRSLARISVYQVFLVLFISVPFYYVWGQAAIVPVITIVAFTQMVLTMFVSYRYYSPLLLIRRWKEENRQGPSMTRKRNISTIRRLVVLGLAFVLSGIMASGADFLIRAYINNVSRLDDVGFFNSGFVLINMYAGMVFVSMDSDYYPRLSSVRHGTQAFRDMVSRQVEVTLLLIAPMLIAMMVLMPIVMPILYSRAFTPVVSMAQVSLLGIFFRAVYLPVEYIPLASARSKTYLVQESVSALLLAVFVILGYSLWGLWGAGAGIAMSYLVEMVFVLCLSRRMFGYVLSSDAIKFLLVHLVLALFAYVCICSDSSVLYWVGGVLCVLVSSAYSLLIMKKTKK